MRSYLGSTPRRDSGVESPYDLACPLPDYLSKSELADKMNI